MPSEWGQRLLDLVDEALGVPPEHRAVWITEACAGDADLAREVAALVGFDDAAEDLLTVSNSEGTVPPSACKGDLQADALENGTQLGDFLIEKQIGAGGMGVVYQAQQRSLHRTVALKVLPAYLRNSRNALARFHREVETAARLQHDNIVAVYMTGDDEGISYYAMELIDGPSLSQVIAELRRDPVPELQSSTPLPRQSESVDASTPAMPNWVTPSLAKTSHVRDGGTVSETPAQRQSGGSYFDRVAHLLAGVADGLDYAHRNQVVHRDIKPSNLLLSSDGRLHVSDFGLARIQAEPSVTQTGEFVGTPYYMAPEQINNGDIDGRTDVYALGATLHELLTLRPPFPGDSRDEVLSRIVREEPMPAKRLNKRVPRDLETICLKALEKEPARRYQTASEMGADLRRFVERLPILARRSGMVSRSLKWCRRRPSMAASLALVVGLALVASLFALRARDALHERDSVEVERDAATARASAIESDLDAAQEVIGVAEQVEYDRLLEKALLAAMQGDAPRAHSATHEAEDRGASPGLVHLLRGQAALPGGRFKTAAQELEKAVELMPESMAAHALLAEVYRKRGHWSQSRLLLDKLDQFETSSSIDLILRGRLESSYDTKKALETLDEAVELDRQSVAARLIRGEVRTKRAASNGSPVDVEGALEDLELARPFIEETPFLQGKFMHAHLVAAAAYESAGQIDEMTKHLGKAAELADQLGKGPDSYQAHRWRGFYFDRMGDDERAIAEWRQIENKTFSFLILTFYRAGQIEEALDACNTARERASSGLADFWYPFVFAATCQSAEQLLDECDFDSLRSRDPKLAWECVHTLWCLMGDADKAAAEVRKIGIEDSLGGLSRRRYQFYCGDRTAEKLLDSTATSRLSLGKSHFHIGMVSLARGDRDEARRHFERSASFRNITAYHTFQSRALLAQLDRDPTWPRWIPAE